VVRLPIIGIIRAGKPILAVENIEGYEVIERRYLNPAYEYFFLRVTGDSMDLIAPEGSLVLIQKEDSIENGEIGIVLIDRQEATMKKVFIQQNIVTLLPMSTNRNHQIQVYDCEKTDIKIIGKAVKIIQQTDLVKAK